MKRMTLNIDLEDNELFEREIKEAIKAEVKNIVRSETKGFVTNEANKEVVRIIGSSEYYTGVIRSSARKEVVEHIRSMLINNEMEDSIVKALTEVLDKAVYSSKIERICNMVIEQRINKEVSNKLRELLGI